MPRSSLVVGLFCTTSSTLAIELLDTRLLSVVTWYHLSFLALSLAMLGMGAGAVHVFLRGPAFAEAEAPGALARWSVAYAGSALLTHLASLSIAVLPSAGVPNFALSVLMLTGVLCVPFVLSGVVVSIVLTRIPGPMGLVYAVDLVGAAVGCLAVLGLLAITDLTSAMEVACAVAALGAAAFCVYAGRPATDPGMLALAALALAALQSTGVAKLYVPASKGRAMVVANLESETWSLHGQVVAYRPTRGQPFYWAAGEGAPTEPVDRMETVIDGLAATAVTRWDGAPGSLDWVSYDLTALPYHVVKGGDVAVIGVGGGRDVLSALWAGSRSVTGIELNRAFLDLHRRLPDFSGIARDPRVTLVNDEARSWITRSDRKFDVIQMSLIDTWAATGAGAFTLSENGLYTEEAFGALIDHLQPDGVLSVSRWYAPRALSETSRLVSLATAALLRAGVDHPRDHLALVTRDKLATLLVTRSPLGERLATVQDVAARYGFGLALTPDAAGNELLGAIASARTEADIDRAVAGLPLDLTPPTDDRPYFFNLVLPGRRPAIGADEGVIAGNLAATGVLGLAVGSSLVVLVGLVVAPLARRGRPALPMPRFVAGLAYFALIGGGFMLAQVGFLQRLGPFLGEPIYAVALVLFSMILASGLGAAASDAVDPARRVGARSGVALASVAGLVIARFALPPLMDATVAAGLGVRALVAVGTVAPASFLLGFHFPLGMRALRSDPGDVAPWMWGINAAAAVVASGGAVVVSMWFGIGATQLAGAGCYLLLAAASHALWTREGR